jgi:hypothetical protein
VRQAGLKPKPEVGISVTQCYGHKARWAGLTT